MRFNPLPLLTDRLQLRLFEEDDLAALVAYRNDPKVARYQSWSEYSLEDAKAFLLEQQGLDWGQSDCWLQIAMASRGDNLLVGDCAVHFIPDQPWVEIGFTLSQAWQGQGLAREGLQALLHVLLIEQGYQSIQAVTDARNQPSIALLEGLGFLPVAGKATRAFFKDEWCDEVVYALDRSSLLPA